MSNIAVAGSIPGGDANTFHQPDQSAAGKMQVDKTSFYPLLLDILTDISEAHFVAFDLELSGVPSKQFGGNTKGKQSLQERYLEIKQAAERYQILQIGITCVSQDVENGRYVLKPYNFELSPLIEERGLDIERIFSFQSGACDFLLNHGFDLSVPFNHGVPYLSRAESKEARQKHAKRNDKSAIAEIQIKPTEIESLAFLARVRREINEWLTSRKLETMGYVNIGKQGADDVIKDTSEPPEELSRFEKRLVHQLVRAEYPDLVTISKRACIQIVRFDKEREDQIAQDRKKELEERINRQKGFRWVIEALHGSDISRIPLKECAKNPVTGEQMFVDMDDMKAQLHRAAAFMRGNPRMMVGHNCFLDLVYIYRHFIGDLPDSVEEFQQKLHNVWPNIVDTKYMSTHNCGDINPVSSLQQIAHQLSEHKEPTLEVDEQHHKYNDVQALHEAGYDSFLTAQIAVRLSAKLEKEGAYVDVASTEKAKVDEKFTDGVNGLKLTEEALDKHEYHVTNGTSPPTDPNAFMPSIEGAKWKRKGDPTLPGSPPDDPFQYHPRDLKHRYYGDEAEETFEGGMPALNSDFWRVYGNKLRVFGTQEGVCPLNSSGGDGEDDVGGVAV